MKRNVSQMQYDTSIDKANVVIKKIRNSKLIELPMYFYDGNGNIFNTKMYHITPDDLEQSKKKGKCIIYRNDGIATVVDELKMSREDILLILNTHLQFDPNNEFKGILKDAYKDKFITMKEKDEYMEKYIKILYEKMI